MMEELLHQVKGEMLRTLIWLLIALAVSIGLYTFLW